MKIIFNILLVSVVLISCKEKDAPSDKITSNVEQIVDPLPSWNDGSSKRNIIAYVTDVSDANSANFIPIEDRIATFDNDGNLWSEQPAYFQLFFAIDRVKAMAADHPEWKDLQPFKAVLDNDMEELKKQGEHGLDRKSVV